MGRNNNSERIPNGNKLYCIVITSKIAEIENLTATLPEF